MNKSIKSTFKYLSIASLCMAFTPILHADLTALESIEYAEPEELCFERLTASNDISQFTLDYVFTLPETDIGQEGRIFVGFRFNNDPDKMYLRFSQSGGSFGWMLYDPDVPLDTRFVASDLAPVVSLKIVKNPMNLSEVNASGGGNVFVGYGFKIHESDTVHEIFQEMMSEERYSEPVQIRNGYASRYNFGSSVVCVETTKYMTKTNMTPVLDTDFSE